jgi:2'-5' RNA ligase
MTGVRLFVAVWPPQSVVDLLAALERPALEGARWTTPDQWHVTLRFLGNMPSADPVLAAVAAAGARPAVASIGPDAERRNPAVLWLPVSGLSALADTVISATADLGRPPENRAFHGHLTLARARRGRLPSVAPMRLSATWDVDEVTVVASTPGGTGSQYEVVGKVALE